MTELEQAISEILDSRRSEIKPGMCGEDIVYNILGKEDLAVIAGHLIKEQKISAAWEWIHENPQNIPYMLGNCLIKREDFLSLERITSEFALLCELKEFAISYSWRNLNKEYLIGLIDDVLEGFFELSEDY